MRKELILILSAVLLISAVYAHQPRIVLNVENSAGNPIIIKNPEISQAFYGELRGKPDYYVLSSDKEFLLYLNILSPVVENASRDFSVEVLYYEASDIPEFPNQGILTTLNGTNYTWTRFYEEFAGDEYWQGPEFEMEAESAIYLVRVYSPDNYGKYALVVGKTESFPANEALKSLVVLPRLKKEFFDKSYLNFFDGKIGKYAGILLLAIAALIALAGWIIKKKKR